MNIEFRILEQTEYREMYYLFQLKRLDDQFYQKNGFIILPSAKTNLSSEVVIPYLDILNNKEVLNSYLKNARNKGSTFPFTLNIEEYRNINIRVKGLEQSHNTEPLISYLEKQKESIRELLELFQISQDFVLEVIPVDFGTHKTVHPTIIGDQLNLRITKRIDHKLGNIFAALILGLVTHSLHTKNQSFDMQLDKHFWLKRQFLVDFIVAKTKFAGLIGDVEPKQVLHSITRLQQLAEVIKQSKKYLKEIGFEGMADLKISGDSLFINDKEIKLTEFEAKLVNYLHKNKNSVCTFDELADVLWKDYPDNYSLYALSKHLSNIRKKINEKGFINSPFYISRGNGILLLG